MNEKCEVKRCRQIGVLTFYGHRVCQSCWHRHCDDNNLFDLKKEFNIAYKSHEITKEESRKRREEVI